MDIDLIDTHCHLDYPDFAPDFDAMLENAARCHVRRVISIGIGAHPENAVALANKYPNIWASVGVHPHDAEKIPGISHIEILAGEPRVVAIGETGLDFFKEWAPREHQVTSFRSQIQLAKRVHKPLIIHCRNAGPECLEILREERADTVGGVFHCYAEDAEFAKKLCEINFLVSFPGIVTFKNALNVQEACKAIPVSQMMLETDGPYLAPVPFRGKRAEPAHVLETARFIAHLKGMSLEELGRATTENALKLFGIQ